MKKLTILALLALAFGITAAEIPLKYGIYAKNKQTTIENGIIIVNNTDGKNGGVNGTVKVNQAAPAKLIFSCESKCEQSITKSRFVFDYAIYVDMTYMDGTKKHSLNTPFATDTTEWQKKALVINESKAIQELRFYILYRNQTGKVQFKNLKLEEIK